MAPLGRPSSSTGRLEAVWTKAIKVADVVSDVMVHAAATSFIHMQMLATSHADQRDRKTWCLRGESQPSCRFECSAEVRIYSSELRMIYFHHLRLNLIS